jgi:hypothetical protein
MTIGSVLLFSIILSCGGTHNSIRFRAESPKIDEAFRRLTLSLRADGYEIASIDTSRRRVVTDWRLLKERELNGGQAGEREDTRVQLNLQMEERGSLFDVELIILLRTANGEAYHPDRRHPLVKKWERILSELLRRDETDEG